MPLTPPPVTDLEAFMHTDFAEGDETRWAEADIQRATDLMHIATGLSTDPADPVAARIMRDGILDMAVRMYVIAGNREELYTPFSSERIGSYSYSKAAGNVQRGESTGVELFDAAVGYLVGLAESSGEGVVRYDTEMVFERKEDGPYLKDVNDYDRDHLNDFFGR